MKKLLPIMLTGFLASLLTCIAAQAYAGEKVAYQNWIVDMSGATTEAHTANDSNSSFGLFCSGEKCLFYLHQALQCQPNAKYSVLMNSANLSTALSMQCTQIGNNLFQILDPFNAVLEALKVGETIGFAIALQSGAFGVARFSLAGSSDAIKRTLSEAARSSQRSSPQTQPPPNSPGTKGIKDIMI